MLFSLIGRLILFDLLKITLMCLSGLTVMFVLAAAMIEANDLGLDPVQILLLIPLLVPPTLPYTIPVSFLFACTFVFSRLSSNQELVALKAGGVHALGVMAPAFCLGIVWSALGFYLIDQFIPHCHQRMQETLIANLETNIYSYLRQTGAISKPDFPYEIYVQDVRDERLINATFKHRMENGKYDFVAQAEEATLAVIRPTDDRADREPIVQIRLMNHEVQSRQGSGHFHDQTYEMPVPGDLAAKKSLTRGFTSHECELEAQEFLRQSSEADFDLAITGAWSSLHGDPSPMAEMIASNRRYADRQERKARELRGEVHSRYAQAISALMFALLGCPIGILFQRRDFLQTFFICFLPIVTVYYPALILAQNFVKEGIAPPAISIWTPSVVLAIASIPLIRRVIRN